MLRTGIVLLLLLCCFCGNGQVSVQTILDSALARVKETSLYIKKINWDSLQREVYHKSEKAQTIADLKPAFETLLNGMGDFHAKVLNVHTYVPIAQFTAYNKIPPRGILKTDMATWKIVNDTAIQFEYKLLGDKTGYLKIVSIGPAVNVLQEAKRIRGAVENLSAKGVDKWIIDLRYNGGGNMNPMLAGIAPLIGDGFAGSLVNLLGEKQFDWEVKKSNFIYGGYQSVALRSNITFKKLPAIAVLTSRYTASSGELVATALKGRPHTRFFGEPTGGYTTNVGWDIIQDEVILCISTGVYADRNNFIYFNNIPVDVEIPFSIIKETAKDPCVLAAKKWLAELK